MVGVLDQDGLLLGLSHPLHVDSLCSHGLPKALRGLKAANLRLGRSDSGDVVGQTLSCAEPRRPPLRLTLNTTPHYPQCSKWRIICCLLFDMLVFYNVNTLMVNLLFFTTTFSWSLFFITYIFEITYRIVGVKS